MNESAAEPLGLTFEERFHLLHLNSCCYCVFVSRKGIQIVALEENEIAVAEKIKTQAWLGPEEKAVAVSLLFKLAVGPGVL